MEQQIVIASSSSTNSDDKSVCCSFVFKCLLYTFILFLIIIPLIILIFLEFLFYYLLCFFLYNTVISIFTQILLHILLLRKIIEHIVFIGQNEFLLKLFNYENIKTKITNVFESFEFIQKVILYSYAHHPTENINYKNSLYHYNQMTTFIDYYINVYSRMSTKFHVLSSQQETLYHSLLLLKNALLVNNAYQLIAFTSKVNKPINIENENCLHKVKDINIALSQIIYLLQSFISQQNSLKVYQQASQVFFNDMFFSLNQSRVELSYCLIYDEYTLITKDKNKLDYIIVHGNIFDNNESTLRNNKHTNLVIVCGPNGSPFEFYACSSQNKMFFNNNCDVLYWNYRGYGYSQGKPSFTALRSDILELFDHIYQQGKYIKYAVHGISIGGVPACYLAEKRKQICLLISDRNFGSIDSVVGTFPCGNTLRWLYKCMWMQHSDNVYNYMNAPCYKVIINDPKDNIVLEAASLKTSIAQYYVNNVLTKGDYNKEYLFFKNKNKSGLDLLLDSNNDKECFIQALLDVVEAISVGNILKSKCKGTKHLPSDNGSEEVSYINIKEETLQNESTVSEYIRNTLVTFLKNFESAGDYLYSLCALSASTKKRLFINNFFSNFVTWGITYTSDEKGVTFCNTNNLDKSIMSHIEHLQSFLNADETQPYMTLNIITNATIINNYLIQMRRNLQNIHQATHINKGHLLPITCGHNGSFTQNELISLYYHVMSSGFIEQPT